MGTCRIIDVKYAGRQKTYNVEMKSPQHNYKIVDGDNFVFSKNSHACAYSFLAYQTAWLKAYFPVEFMCSLLSSVVSEQQKDKREKYESLLPKMGIELLPFDINMSKDIYTIEKNGIRQPLSIMKGIGDIAIKDIVEHQPYKDLMDFLSKNTGHSVNKNVFLALVENGAMLCWGGKDKVMDMFHFIKENITKQKKKNKDNAAYIETLFDFSK